MINQRNTLMRRTPHLRTILLPRHQNPMNLKANEGEKSDDSLDEKNSTPLNQIV
jgi:hypothetical protein